MNRIPQVILIGSMLLLSCLGMMIVHEFGHVVGAWTSGGQVTRVVLHPLTISRTDLGDNPHPLWVAWTGPVLGAILPLIAWGISTRLRLPWTYLLRFFAGFCLVANGAYLGFGSFDEVGDAGELLRHGAPIWQLWLFGAVTLPVGILLWHRLGPAFGLGSAHGQVNRRAAWGCLFLLLLVIGAELVWSER